MLLRRLPFRLHAEADKLVLLECVGGVVKYRAVRV